MPTAPPTGPGPAKPTGFTGRTIARCLVGEKLGRGATSHVFRAHYEPLGKDIALKILSKDAAGSEQMRARFLSEARAVAKLNHENIVKVLDVVEDKQLLCILMELVEGPTLQDRLDDENVLPPRQALRIAAQIARALEAAHEEKIVHRDVKPANVMLLGKPGEEIVKVVDFGLAAQQEMNRVGTPLFMSPEAAQGKRIDEKSDVYAVGVVLYRMLTGTLPFTGATVKDILAAHVNAELVPASERRPTLGKQYDDVIKKLLVKSKGYRPDAGTAADILEDMADDLEEREEGVRQIRRRKKRIVKKKPVNPAVWAGLAIAGVIVVILVMVLSGGKPAPVTPGGTDPSQPGAAVVSPAEKAYKEVEAWAALNPSKSAEAARKWESIEKQFAGTPWGTKAGLRHVEEAAIAKKQAEADAAAEEQRRKNDEKNRAAAANDPKVKFAEFERLVRALDFGQASSVMSGLEPPAEMDIKVWDQRQSRLDYLAKHFVNKMDVGFRESRPPFKAKDLFPDAKDGETIDGASSAGARAFDGKERRTLYWPTAKPEAFVTMRVIPDKVLNTELFESNVVIAALAYELGFPDRAKKYVDTARSQASDPDGTQAALVDSLFGK